MTKLIFGCGYLGSRVAKRWLAAGEKVRIVTRSEDKAKELSAAGYEAFVADILRKGSLRSEILSDVSTILFSVGFDRSTGTIAEVYLQGLTNVVHACGLLSQIPQIIYISTTGVYGQGTGEWITEQVPTSPRTAGANASLLAETMLMRPTGPRNGKSLVLRLAGIYGPGRIPRVQDVREGKPITAHPASWLNLIHVDDAAQIIVNCARRRIVNGLFNVTDGHPVERRDFYREVARLVKAPPPTFIEPSPEELATTRGGDKRISNAHLLATLQPKFQYPSYREGLHAILSDS